jgi:glycosyltransferase involved in cell wall biosynthesis
MKSSPLFSVVIPVKNRAEKLRQCLAALAQQTLSSELFEILVVDNGSIDDLKEVCSGFENIGYIRECKIGSYIARNTGIRASSGRIIALTDSDCIPDMNWLLSAQRHFLEKQPLIGAGSIHYSTARNDSNLFEWFEESVMPLDNQEVFVTKGYAATANLFIERRTFFAVGPFAEDMMSLSDIDWGGRASKMGYKILFLPDVMVRHPRRSTHSEIVRKVRRTAGGQFQIVRREKGLFKAGFALLRYAPLTPFFISVVWNYIRERKAPSKFAFIAASFHYAIVATFERMRVMSGLRPYPGD